MCHCLSPQGFDAQTPGKPLPACCLLSGIQRGLSPVVTAIGPHQLSARTVALPGQQVQAAAVTGLHADGPIDTQYLAQGTVAAWLAVPHTVLEGWAESKQGLVSRKQPVVGSQEESQTRLEG